MVELQCGGKFQAIDEVLYLQPNEEIKEDCLYHLIEVYTYGGEKSPYIFSFPHDMQRFIHILCPLLKGPIFNFKVKSLYYNVLCGNCWKWACFSWGFTKCLNLMKPFKFHREVIANHSDENRFLERRCYISYFLPLEVKFFPVHLFSSWEQTLTYGAAQINIWNCLTQFPIELVFNFTEISRNQWY